MDFYNITKADLDSIVDIIQIDSEKNIMKIIPTTVKALFTKKFYIFKCIYYNILFLIIVIIIINIH